MGSNILSLTRADTASRLLGFLAVAYLARTVGPEGGNFKRGTHESCTQVYNYTSGSITGDTHFIFYSSFPNAGHTTTAQHYSYLSFRTFAVSPCPRMGLSGIEKNDRPRYR